MIWTLITFVVLLLVLKKFAFGPIQNMIDNRRNAIAESIEAAENTRREAERLLAEYRESIANAKREAEEIIERAHKVGESTKNDIVNEARDLAQKEVDDARKQIQRETRKAIRELKDEVADLAILAAGKVTSKSINKEDHLRLVDEALSEVDFDKLASEGD
ncbi:ATP synthase subunit b, sodium ion specific [bacterium BMS3Abin01]|nr:ATP synthase subunit b, sodium ion specific [bacterium BMS3Abin01]